MANRQLRPPLQPMQYARNGKYPDANYVAEMAALAGHLSAFRMKEIASFGMTTDFITGATGDRPRWRARFRTSPYVEVVVCYAIIAPQVSEGSTDGGYAKVEIADTGGTVRGIGKLAFSESSDSDVPNDLLLCVTTVRDNAATTQDWEPTADTIYNVTVSDHYSRIVALSIWEGSSDGAGVHSGGYAAGTPILDTQRESLITSARLMWKQQGAQLFTWTVDDQASPRTRTSATACNLIDNSTTTVATSTPGFTIDLRNRSTVSRTTVPCVLSVYGKVANALGSGSVQLRDSTNTVLATVGFSSTTASWQTTTVNLPATRHKLDLYFSGDAVFALSVYSVTLSQYASGT